MNHVARLAVGLAFSAALLSAPIDASSQPVAPSAGLVVVESPNSVAETEKRLIGALDAAGLKLAARVDHAANAEGAGLKLPPTLLLIFGNPKAGTVLMEKNRTIGIDLPLKALIWEAEGKVRLAYNDPAYLARRHGIDEVDPVVAQVRQALQRFTSAATAQ